MNDPAVRSECDRSRRPDLPGTKPARTGSVKQGRRPPRQRLVLDRTEHAGNIRPIGGKHNLTGFVTPAVCPIYWWHNSRPYGYAPYEYGSNYAVYGYPPPYYQPAPSLGLGFGYFGGRRADEREWHERHDGSREHYGGRSPAGLNMPPAHALPPAIHSAPPPVARSAPAPAANAAALDRLGFRANPHP
jgi:hypothetical protein